MTNLTTIHPILRRLGRYLLALGFVVAGFLLCVAMPQVMAPRPFLAFWPVVVLAAEFGGRGPGVLATAVSVLCVHLMLGPSLSALNPSDWIGLTATGIFLAGGLAISVFIGGKRKIQTHQRLQAAALVASEARYRNLFEAANVGKSVTLPTGEIEVNRAFCDMLGYVPEELRGKKWQELTPPEEISPINELLAPVLRGEKNAVRFNKRYLHKDGSVVWADVSTALRRDATGRPLHFITTIVDLTPRIRAEEGLRLAEDRFRLAFHLSPAGLTITRIADGKIIEANATFLRMFGFTHEQVIGHTSVELEMLTPQQRSEIIRCQTETGGVRQLEMQARASSGRMLDLLASSQPIEIGGEAVHITHLVDITERKQAEKALRQQAEALHASNAELEQFNRAMIGRELRMMELKQEINELCRRLGEPPRHAMAPLPTDGVRGAGTAPPSGGGA